MAKSQPKDLVLYEKRCKICNSEFRGMIENLHIQNMNPRQIMEYLGGLSGPGEQEQIKQDEITESAIRRHLARHFDIKTGAQIKIAETKTRLQQSRDQYKQGVRVMVDNVGLISHMIESLMIQMEELDNMADGRVRHQLTLNYAGQVKGLVESLAKLTGELRQEGTIDINFFSDEITRFADIVHSTVKTLDMQMGLDNKLEYSFATEFKKQWDSYQLRQNRIACGELSTDDGMKERNVNTFNEGE